MTTSVIVAGARTPIGKLMGSLKDFSGSDLGAIAIAGALEKAKRAGVGRRVRDHGPGADRRGRADARPAGRGGRGHRLGRAVADHQQDVPVGHRRHRAGRSADPGGRVRRGGGRWAGVDDQGAAPADGQPRRATSTATSRCSTTWPTTVCTTCSPTSRWARSPSSATTSTSSPASSRTSSPRGRTRRPPRRGRTASSPTRWCR